jgi:hypothetical protein
MRDCHVTGRDRNVTTLPFSIGSVTRHAGRKDVTLEGLVEAHPGMFGAQRAELCGERGTASRLPVQSILKRSRRRTECAR